VGAKNADRPDRRGDQEAYEHPFEEKYQIHG
jgi:hypothetical protein